MAKKKAKQPAKLQEALVLFKYILSLFGCKDLAALSNDLKDPALEGVDDEECSRLFHALKRHLYADVGISEQELREYDCHIVKYTSEINEHREEKIVWKYYPLFSNSFLLAQSGMRIGEEEKFARETYIKVMNTLFHSNVPNARLHLDRKR